MWDELWDLVDIGGLDSLIDGGSDFVGDLPVELVTESDFPLATDFYTGPSDLMDGFQGTVGDFTAGSGLDGGMGGLNGGEGSSGSFGSGLSRLLGDAWDRFKSGLSSGGGSGRPFSVPAISSSVADRIQGMPVPAYPAGGVPATQPADATFRPMVGGSGATAQPADLSGLMRLLARQPADPYAEARALTAPRGGG
jgi:hypothetical protein